MISTNPSNFESTGRIREYAVKCTWCGKDQIRDVKSKIVTCYKCFQLKQKMNHEKRKLKKKGEANVETPQKVL